MQTLKKITGLMLLLSCSILHALTLNDTGGISATPISFVVNVKSEEDILKAINQAKKQHVPIAIMGMQHSQGGQTLLHKAIELNMLTFNQVLNIDIPKKQVTVQSGIVWADLQKAINPYNLAIKSMQSPNIFTVGGSMSVNAHGDDFRSGSVGNSVVAFHMLLADGEKVYVTPDTRPGLWSAVIGGYGLLGIVTDVTLQLTDNNLLLSEYHETELTNIPSYFIERILNQKDIALFYAHLNITPGRGFLRDMYVITYKNTHQLPDKVIGLDNPDKWNKILSPIFNTSRQSKLGKNLRWRTEKIIFRKIYNGHLVTRNNAMEKPVRFASDHVKKGYADWLQEYFIPLDNLPKFMNALRQVALDNDINILNVTIRSVPQEKNLLLSYSTQRTFAVVLYFEQNLSPEELNKVKLWTPTLIDAALSLDGNYYLPYQPYASKNQFRTAYPSYAAFLTVKHQFDSGELFSNKFYLNYLN